MTTLLFDLNNLMMRNFFHKEVEGTTENPSYNLWKFLIFDQIYWDIIRFKEYGIDEVVLAVDSPDTWRKLYFPRYKEKRKSQRSEDIDWDRLFLEYESFQESIRNNIPFKVLKVKKCEADDIIGVLCYKIKDTDFIVVSNDEDYKQLCGLSNVKVFEPKSKAFVECSDTEKFIDKLCLKGQSKDGIFNAKTPTDYPSELRKPPLGDKMADKIMEESIGDFLNKEIKISKKYFDVNGIEQKYETNFCPTVLYHRNKILLDFRAIPKVLTTAILKCYNNYMLPGPEKMYDFFVEQGWTSYLESYNITENVLLKLR